MRFEAVDFGAQAPIDGYGPGFFRIGGEVFEGPLVLTGEGVAPWGGLEDTEAIRALAGRIDVLFVGMGEEMAHLPPALAAAMAEGGVMGEPMPTPAACRSYNVLLGEGRRVGAALLPVG